MLLTVDSPENVESNRNMDEKTLRADRALIAEFGGPTKLARKLGYDTEGGRQRVHMWKRRGIPPSIKVQFPHFFLRDFMLGRSVSPPTGDRRTEDRAPTISDTSQSDE